MASLLSSANTSHAACDGLGGQCSVTDGSTQTFSGGIYETTGSAASETALYASGNGSTIRMTGGQLHLNPSDLISVPTARAENDGKIRLQDVSVYGGGIYVDDARLELSGNLEITTTTDNTNAMTFLNTPRLYAEYFNSLITIKTSGQSSHGIWFYGDGGFDMEALDIATTGNHSIGLFMRFKDLSLWSGMDPFIALYDTTTITTTGDYSPAVHLVDLSALYAMDDLTATTSGTNSHALVLAGGSMIQLNPGSKINAHGTGSHGVLFEESPTGFNDHWAENWAFADGAELTATQATAVVAQTTVRNIVSAYNSRLYGADRLVQVKNFVDGSGASHPTRLRIEAVGSKLVGGAAVENLSRLEMWLQYDFYTKQYSEWTLRHAASGNSLSEVSTLYLENSIVRFDAPQNGVYQILRVGTGDPGTTLVYRASNNNNYVVINTLLNTGGPWNNQFTDRLLIEGDVSGQTFVKINEMAGSAGGQTSLSGANLAHEGISIIQVSGNAQENSFVLDGGYMTMAEMPYTYTLYAYGPGSSNGAADPSQRQVSGNEHWDYRLQSECIGPCPSPSPPSPPSPPPKQVAPQVANYLVAPTALFHAGLQNIGNLQQRLGQMRVQAMNGANASNDRFFLHRISGDYHYRSNLKPERYGYAAHMNYAAMQMGSDLYGAELDNSSLRSGLSSTRANLAFAPDRTGSQKTTMHIWNITPYMSWQHDSGAYLDAMVSYGHFDGSVITPARGRTARLQGHTSAASLGIGKPIVLMAADLILEPQFAITYQQLKFNETRDVDNFAVKLADPEQTTLKIGTELSKSFANPTTGKHGTLYGHIHLIRNVNDHHNAWFGDTFEVGRSGTQLKTGAGIQADLRKNVHLYSDVSWQAPVSSAGTRGMSLNLGVNVRF